MNSDYCTSPWNARWWNLGCATRPSLAIQETVRGTWATQPSRTTHKTVQPSDVRNGRRTERRTNETDEKLGGRIVSAFIIRYRLGKDLKSQTKSILIKFLEINIVNYNIIWILYQNIFHDVSNGNDFSL